MTELKFIGKYDVEIISAKSDIGKDIVRLKALEHIPAKISDIEKGETFTTKRSNLWSNSEE